MNLPLPSRNRSSRRLLAALALGIASVAVVPSAAAAVVTINLNDTRNDGSTTTDDTISGPNAGLSYGAVAFINDWLGAGTGPIILSNGYASANDQVWAIVGDLAYSNVNGDLTLFNGGATINASNFVFTIGNGSAFRLDDTTVNPAVTNSMPAFSQNTYLGFRFANGPGYNYGYLGVTWDGTSTFQITSGAYETTVDQAITTPGGSVPDSSSTGLMGLLFAGAAMRQWRKTRR
jgi:hypothetical protein